jgi:DNA-directed RNA polymerase specialized sigma24 family protein
MLNTTHREILNLRSDMRRVVASVLRTSRYYSDDDIEECLSFVMVQALDYGARTFDPSKGNAKSHFTCFAKQRARNWLYAGHRRYEVADETTNEDGETTSHSEAVPADGNPQLTMMTSQNMERVRRALDTLDERSRSLVEAFLRLGSWFHAAREIGVSPATASRMKERIIAAAQALAL